MRNNLTAKIKLQALLDKQRVKTRGVLPCKFLERILCEVISPAFPGRKSKEDNPYYFVHPQSSVIFLSPCNWGRLWIENGTWYMQEMCYTTELWTLTLSLNSCRTEQQHSTKDAEPLMSIHWLWLSNQLLVHQTVVLSTPRFTILTTRIFHVQERTTHGTWTAKSSYCSAKHKIVKNTTQNVNYCQGHWEMLYINTRN